MKLFKDWSLFERIWLLSFLTVIVVASIIFGDTLIGFVASVTGVLCVVLVAKGKISNFLFGLINAITYGYISYQSQLYGEAMLNIFLYVPLQFIGFYVWKKNMNGGDIKSTVKAKSLTVEGWIATLMMVVVTTIVYAFILQNLGSQQVGVDSLSTILSIVAQFLMLKRYAEQWLLWIIINILNVILWINVFAIDGNSVTILVMHLAFLLNSVYGYLTWRKMSKEVLV